MTQWNTASMPVTWRNHRHPIPQSTPPVITRRWFPGYFTALNDSQVGQNPTAYNPKRIPNHGTRTATGPVSNHVKGLMIRRFWNQLEPCGQTSNDADRFDFSLIDQDIADCAAYPADTDGQVGVKLMILLVTRTFTGFNLETPFNLSGVTITGTAGQFHCTAASTTLDTTFAVSITGTFGGTGSITGYAAAHVYYVSVTNGSTTFTLTERDGTAIVTTAGTPTGLTYRVIDSFNPLPADLVNKSEIFHTGIGTGAGGWQTWRWSPTVSSRFQELMTALGNRYDTNDFFGGIATQETSTGDSAGGSGADAYSSTAFILGLQNESRSISNAFPHGRHMCYTNFINGPFFAPISNVHDALDAVAVVVQANGGIWGGPDLVVSGNVTTNSYPTYNKVHNATSPILGKGPTFCSIQPSEWNQDQAPADPANPQTVSDLYDYGTGVARNYGHGVQTPPLNLDIFVVDWHTAGGYAGQKYNPDWVTVMNANPIPFGTFTP
jgi:hypothetical protein